MLLRFYQLVRPRLISIPALTNETSALTDMGRHPFNSYPPYNLNVQVYTSRLCTHHQLPNTTGFKFSSQSGPHTHLTPTFCIIHMSINNNNTLYVDILMDRCRLTVAYFRSKLETTSTHSHKHTTALFHVWPKVIKKCVNNLITSWQLPHKNNPPLSFLPPLLLGSTPPLALFHSSSWPGSFTWSPFFFYRSSLFWFLQWFI